MESMKLNNNKMMKTFFLLLGLVVGSTLALPSVSRAGSRISLLGIAEYALPRTGTRSAGVGGGASFEIGFGSAPVAFDIGAFFVQRGFGTTSTSTLHAPAFLRFNFAKDIVSLGLGFFFDYYPSSRGYDYGPNSSLQFRIPMGSMLSFVLDGRFGVGLASFGTGSFYTMYVQGLAGLSFRLGAKK